MLGRNLRFTRLTVTQKCNATLMQPGFAWHRALSPPANELIVCGSAVTTALATWAYMVPRVRLVVHNFRCSSKPPVDFNGDDAVVPNVGITHLTIEVHADHTDADTGSSVPWTSWAIPRFLNAPHHWTSDTNPLRELALKLHGTERNLIEWLTALRERFSSSSKSWPHLRVHLCMAVTKPDQSRAVSVDRGEHCYAALCKAAGYWEEEVAPGRVHMVLRPHDTIFRIPDHRLHLRMSTPDAPMKPPTSLPVRLLRAWGEGRIRWYEQWPKYLT
jgi:hypothetical protein